MSQIRGEDKNIRHESPVDFFLSCGGGYVSGKEVVSLELGSGLKTHGYKVRFIVSSWNDGEFVRRLRRKGLDYEEMALGFISASSAPRHLRMAGEQVAQWFPLLRRYAAALKEHRPRIVIHTNWHHLLLLGPQLRPDRDVFWVHDVIPAKLRYRLFFGALDKRIRGFIAVSQAVARSLTRLGLPGSRVKVVHNGLADPCPDCLGPKPREKVFRLGLIGQIAEWKGHEDALAAVASAVSKYPELELHVFGKGDAAYETALQRYADELGISQNVKWRGFIADRTTIYHELDACVVLSRNEDPLPTSAIEAAFFGLPVIATRTGGLPEIVEDNQTGILVEPRAPTQVANAIRGLIENPSFSIAAGRAARMRAVSNFSRRRFIHEFLRALDQRVCL